MKSNAVLRIVIYSILALILIIALIAGLLVRNFAIDFKFGFSEIQGTRGSSGSVNAADVQALKIEWVAGNVKVQPGDTDQITFQEDEGLAEKDQLIWDLSGNCLTIHYMQPRVNIGISVEISKDLIITVPKEWICTDLEVNAVSAIVDVTGLQIDTVEFEGVSGTCNFHDCDVGAMNIESVSGNIQFSGTMKKLDCESMSSNVTAVFFTIPSNINIESMSGDIDLTLPSDCGFRVEMDALSGDFYSEFPTTNNNGSYIHGNEQCLINIDAMSGDVTIRTGK